MSEKQLTIIEPHDLVDSSHVVGLTEYRLFQMVVGGIYVKDGLIEDKEYMVSSQDYAKVFEINQHSAYQSLIEAVTKFDQKHLEVKRELLEDKDGLVKHHERKKDYIKFHWFSTIAYNNEDSYVGIRFSRELIYLFNKVSLGEKLYAKYLFENTRRMQSINSIRLFRVVNKWKKKQSFKCSIEELKRLLGFINGEYKEFDNLKNKVILPAIADINRLTDINVDVNWEKRGRRMVGVEFIVKVKEGL